MDDQNDSGAQKREIINPVSETNPTVIIPNANPTIINSIPFIRRRWVKNTAIAAIICALITVVAAFTEIPNNVMGWIINYRSLSKPQNPPPSVVVMPRPDYIEGTTFTLSQIKKDFPYGYAVFRLEDAKWTYELYTENHFKWHIDWSKVTIKPDFNERSISWTLPNLSGNNPELPPQKQFSYDSDDVYGTTPMRVGAVYNISNSIFRTPENQPDIFVGMLSDDQLHPVCVIGFRIRQGPEPIINK